jgi:MFS family permease
VPFTPPALPICRRKALWRDRDFVRLWLGQTASQFGAQASQVTLPLVAVLALNSGADQLGGLRAVQQAPILLISLFVGAWVDRWRSRNVMVLADFGRAVALAAIPIAYLFGALGFPLLYAVALCVGILTVFFDVAYQASLVRLVQRDQLAQGNSVLEGSRSAAQIGGPAVAGALTSLLVAPIAVAASSIFFLASFLSIRRISKNERLPKYTDGLWRQIHEGLQLVARDSSLRTVCLASAIFQFFLAVVMTVYLLFLPRTLELPGAVVGLALAAMGLGAVAGSVLAGSLPRKIGYGRVVVLAAAIADGAMLCVPALHGSSLLTIILLMAMNFVFGAFGQLVDVTMMAIRQAVTPIQLQGRVVATINFIGMGLTPLGSLLGGYLAGQWGLRSTLALAAAGLLMCPLLLALSPIARLGRVLPVPRSGHGAELAG